MRCGVENPMDADVLIVFEFRGSSMDEGKATGTTLPVLHFIVFYHKVPLKAIMRIIPMQ